MSSRPLGGAFTTYPLNYHPPKKKLSYHPHLHPLHPPGYAYGNLVGMNTCYEEPQKLLNFGGHLTVDLESYFRSFWIVKLSIA